MNEDRLTRKVYEIEKWMNQMVGDKQLQNDLEEIQIEQETIIDKSELRAVQRFKNIERS